MPRRYGARGRDEDFVEDKREREPCHYCGTPTTQLGYHYKGSTYPACCMNCIPKWEPVSGAEEKAVLVRVDERELRRRMGR